MEGEVLRRAQAELETENARLKKLLADIMLDNALLKDFLGKKCRRPRRSARRGVGSAIAASA